jgi:hypothetical protein
MLLGYLREDTASQLRTIPVVFVDQTDGFTAETGLTIAASDVKMSKNGAATVNKNSGGGTHIVNGMYAFTFDATDSNTVGQLSVTIIVSGARPVYGHFVVLEEAVYDNLFAASAVGPLTAAATNAEVLDALATDTYAEPTGVPGATVSLSTKIGYIYMALRNKLTITSTKLQFFDDGGAAEWEKDLTDDGTTYTETEGNSP